MFIDAVRFPSSFFDRNTVDEELKKEYYAALDCGKFREMLLFSYEDWFHKDTLRLSRLPDKKIHAVYRGWMMKPERYRAFYEALLSCNVELITTPVEYERFHVFPNMYSFIREDTPEILLFPRGERVDLELIKEKFPAFLIKDYVKSVKGTDFPSRFDRSVTQAAFDRYMELFYKYRGELFTGGICVKEFVRLKTYGGRKNEFRVFYINGMAATVSRNSGQGSYTPAPPEALYRKYEDMGSPFYTVDYAELEDGSWTIIELGDGSVSGLSDGQDYVEFFRALHNYMRVELWRRWADGNAPSGILLRREELEGKAKILLERRKKGLAVTWEISGLTGCAVFFDEPEAMSGYKAIKEEITLFFSIPRNEKEGASFCEHLVERYKQKSEG